MAAPIYISNQRGATDILVDNKATKEAVIVGSSFPGATPVRIVGRKFSDTVVVKLVGSNFLVNNETLLDASTIFDPSSISGLLFWFTGSSINLADGAAIPSWQAYFPPTISALQAVGGNQPIYKTNQINGNPVVRFDGTDDRLVTASISHGIGTGDLFYAAVIKTASSLSGYHAICANGNFLPGFYLNGTKVDLYIVGDRVFSTVLNISTWYTIIVRRLSGVLDCTINGVADVTTIANNDIISNGITTIGDENDITSTPWNSDIAELFFGKTLSDANRTSLTAYLRNKYAHY